MARNTGDETATDRAARAPQARWVRVPDEVVDNDQALLLFGPSNKLADGEPLLVSPPDAVVGDALPDPDGALVDGVTAQPGGDGPPDGQPQDDEGEPARAVEPDAELPKADGLLTWISIFAVLASLAATIVLVGAGAIASQADEADWGGWPIDRWKSAAFATGVLFCFLGILHAGDRKSNGAGASKGYGIFRPVIGDDRRWSTSLTQLALWTLAVGIALAFLAGRVMFEDVTFAAVLPGARWDEYLLLLGGPFSAAVLAKGLVTYKTTNGSLQKTEPAVSDTPTASQIFKSDAGGSDLIDAQYLLFNIVALGYFVVQFVSTSTLPEMPSPLLALTGGAAALYTANKAVASNPPTITAVTPRTATWGDTVTIFGTNFVPGGDSTPGRQATVSITGCTASIATIGPAESTKVRFRVPTSAAPGQQTLVVTSASGVQTPPQDIEIRANQPVLLGLADGEVLRPGQEVTLTGRDLGRSGELVSITVAGVQVTGAVSEAGAAVRFQLPPGVLVTETTATVKLALPNRTDAEIVLPVDRPRVVSAVRKSAQALTVRVAGAGADPFITVNDRAASASPEGDSFTVALPAGQRASDLRVRAIDELGRRSEELLLPADG